MEEDNNESGNNPEARTEVTEPATKEADEGQEKVDGEEVTVEHLEGEHSEGEHVQGEEVGGEQLESEYAEGEQREGEEKKIAEDEELLGEELEDEHAKDEAEQKEEEEQKAAEEEKVEEEQAYVEEPPPDPAAPLDLSDSKEALREPFDLRPDQLAEVEQLWEYYQNYTPAYTNIDGYITAKELVYMLKALLLMTYTPEQFEELILFCVRPPHPEGHITYEQFLKIVKIRQRDFGTEDEIRAAFQVLDPEKTGEVDREYLKEVLAKRGHKMPQKHLDNFIKEVDMANDGTIGIEDAVGTMCIDLNPEDLQLLRAAIFGSQDTEENKEGQLD